MRRTLLTLGLLVATLAATVTTASAQSPGASIRDHRKAPAGGKATGTAEALFDRADTDHDGRISKPEFRRAAASIPVLKLKPGDADKLFNQLDTNRDGFLTKV